VVEFGVVGKGFFFFFFFSNDEMVTIQSIPISITDQADVQIWRGTKNGVFLVQSAYHLLKESEMAKMAGGSRCTQKRSIWTNIWQLQIPNAKKVFLWHAYHKSLPTRDNLCIRKVISDPNYPICEKGARNHLPCIMALPSCEGCLEQRGNFFPEELV
jgi:hypothetical protein